MPNTANVLMGCLQADACLAGWRDLFKWGTCFRPGMGLNQGEAMGRSSCLVPLPSLSVWRDRALQRG